MPRYFDLPADAPAPICKSISRRAQFCEIDALRIVWNGHYLAFFENAATELRRVCGLDYNDFIDYQIVAPIVQSHVDYHHPIYLDEEFRVTAMLVWTEAARLNIEYELRKGDDILVATGYTVQLFVDAKSNDIYYVKPDLLEACWQRGKTGDRDDLQ